RERRVDRRWADAVQPAAPMGAARRGERGTGQLLRVQPVRDPLRRVAPDRQRAGDGLGGELVAEARLVAIRFHRRRSRLQHAALDLVALDALEQRLEVAFAETFIALA